MPDRPVLLFDIMDTLVYNPFRREIPNFFGLTREELLVQKDPTAWTDFELGQIDEAAYFRRYFRDRRRFDEDEFRRVVARAYRWVDDAERMLSQLVRAGFEMHALSNYPIWYRTIEHELELSRYLSWTFVSCLTGVRKPAEEAYILAARSLNRSPGECLFIDDNRENCEAAESLGMPSIHFSDMAQLEGHFHRIGYLP